MFEIFRFYNEKNYSRIWKEKKEKHRTQSKRNVSNAHHDNSSTGRHKRTATGGEGVVLCLMTDTYNRRFDRSPEE